MVLVLHLIGWLGGWREFYKPIKEGSEANQCNLGLRATLTAFEGLLSIWFRNVRKNEWMGLWRIGHTQMRLFQCCVLEWHTNGRGKNKRWKERLKDEYL